MEEFANMIIPKSDHMCRIETACNDKVSFGPLLVLMLVKIICSTAYLSNFLDKYSKWSVILISSSSVPKSIVEVK